MSPSIWLFVRALELERQQQSQRAARPLDPAVDATAARCPVAPVALT